MNWHRCRHNGTQISSIAVFTFHKCIAFIFSRIHERRDALDKIYHEHILIKNDHDIAYFRSRSLLGEYFGEELNSDWWCLLQDNVCPVSRYSNAKLISFRISIRRCSCHSSRYSHCYYGWKEKNFRINYTSHLGSFLSADEEKRLPNHTQFRHPFRALSKGEE